MPSHGRCNAQDWLLLISLSSMTTVALGSEHDTTRPSIIEYKPLNKTVVQAVHSWMYLKFDEPVKVCYTITHGGVDLCARKLRC